MNKLVVKEDWTNEPGAPRLRWVLDFPRIDDWLDPAAGRLRVQGWCLAAQGRMVGAALLRFHDAAASLRRVPLEMPRPDVIERVLGAPPANHPLLRAGFAADIEAPLAGFDLGFDVDGQVQWVRSYQYEGSLKVLRGNGDWLFLDNDTNHSVDQYAGRLLLTRQQEKEWASFLDQVAKSAGRLRTRHLVAVVPAKETVLGEHYPHAMGAVTPLEQLRQLVRPKHRCLDLAPALRKLDPPEVGFIRTDTHWTDRGARAGVLAVIDALGLDRSAAETNSAGDRYSVREFVGDLGNKLVPPVSAPTEFVQADLRGSVMSFDNGLPNLGRVMVFACEAAPFQQSLLIFGASSSHSMLKFLRRLFRRVVFVHNAAGLDLGVLEHERPDYLLLQTNARFVVQVPSADSSLCEMASSKLIEAEIAVHRRLHEMTGELPEEHPNRYYLDMLLPHLRTDLADA